MIKKLFLPLLALALGATTKTTKNTQKIISMNWGIDRSGTFNDIGFAVETPTWVAGNLSYNYKIVLH